MATSAMRIILRGGRKSTPISLIRLATLPLTDFKHEAPSQLLTPFSGVVSNNDLAHPCASLRSFFGTSSGAKNSKWKEEIKSEDDDEFADDEEYDSFDEDDDDFNGEDEEEGSQDEFESPRKK